MDKPSKQNLYRLYRPKSFGELSGQDHIVRTLQSAIASGRISHAYMFSGPRGTGKTSAARLLAKTVNCLSPVAQEANTVDACCLCDVCTRIDALNFMDIIEIDAASNNSVDDIRQMREKVKYAPIEGKYKVYIIDEVHMLSGAAFNAFLKTLEEPPPRIIFILATTDLQKVPATIISRCQCFEFHPIPKKVIMKRLSEIAELERKNNPGKFPRISAEAIAVIAESVSGGFRDAIGLLDQVANSSCCEEILADHVLALTRRMNFKALQQLVSAMFENRPKDLILQMDGLFGGGYDVMTIGRDILEFFRQCLLMKIDQKIGEILEISTDRIDCITKMVKELSAEYLLSLTTLLERTLPGLRNSVDPRILLEMTFLRMSMKELSLGDKGLERRIERIESRTTEIIKLSSPVGKLSLPMEIKQSETSTNIEKLPEIQPAVSSNLSPIDLNAKFRRFKSALFKKDRIMGAIYEAAVAESFINGTLVISMNNSFTEKRASEPQSLDLVKTLLEKEFGCGVRFMIGKSAQSADNTGYADDQKENIPAKSHNQTIAEIDKTSRRKILQKPSVAEALAVFGGEVTEIIKK